MVLLLGQTVLEVHIFEEVSTILFMLMKYNRKIVFIMHSQEKHCSCLVMNIFERASGEGNLD